jgi:hypothetical protein
MQSSKVIMNEPAPGRNPFLCGALCGAVLRRVKVKESESFT